MNKLQRGATPGRGGAMVIATALLMAGAGLAWLLPAQTIQNQSGETSQAALLNGFRHVEVASVSFPAKRPVYCALRLRFR